MAGVVLPLANHHGSLPVAYRLYLPKASWADDAARRRKAGVPEDVVFKTKPEIGLEMTRSACEPGLPGAPAIFDAGFGHDRKLRAGVTGTGEGLCGRHPAANLGVETVFPRRG